MSRFRCQFGPEGCDPQGGELVPCTVCNKRACDFHGDYPTDAAYAEGDWRCPDHKVAPREFDQGENDG